MALTLQDLLTYTQDSWYDKNRVKDIRMETRAINEGVSMIARRKDWKRFRSRGRIRFRAPAVSGTVTVANGGSTATLVAPALWPTDVVGMCLKFGDDYVDHEVGVRTSAQIATFIASDYYYGTAVNAGAYTIFQYKYSLPTDFQRFSRPYHATMFGPLAVVQQEVIEERRMAEKFSTGTPDMCAVLNNAVWVWPPPDTDGGTIEFIYQRLPTAMTDVGNSGDWDDEMRDLLWRAVDLQMARQTHSDKLPFYVQEFEREFSLASDDRKTGVIEFGLPTIGDSGGNRIVTPRGIYFDPQET
jgi:hypothetical protein